MTTVKVKFRPSTVEGRPGIIVYFVTHRRVVRQITTGYKVFSHEWDDKQSRPVSAPAGERITVIQTIIRKLEENLEKLNRIIERFDLLRRGYSSEDIIMEFRCTEKENTLFYIHGESHRATLPIKSHRYGQELPYRTRQLQMIPG